MAKKPTCEELERKLKEMQENAANAKQAEKALQESEKRYRNLYDNAQVGLYRSRLRDGKMVMANNRMAEMFGYQNAEECIAKYVATEHYVHPETENKLLEILHENGKFTNFEAAIKKDDGSIVWLQFSGILSSEEGYFEGVATEITDRKLAEEALRKSEKKYRTLIKNAGEAIIVAQDGVFKFANPKGEDLFGYSQEELTARPLTDFIHEEDREIVNERHEKRLRGETLPILYSFRIVHKDGHIKWVELNVILFSWENKPATLCFMTDITERIQTEESLKAAERNLLKAERMAHLGVWTWNIQNNEEWWSDEQLRIFGYKPGQIKPINETFTKALHPEDADAVFEATRKTLEEDEPYDIEYRIVRPDGDIRYVHAQGDVERSRGGNPLRMTGTVLDITEQKKVEEVMKESEEKFRSISSSANDAILTMDINGNITYWNKAATRIFGYREKEAMGQFLHSLLVPKKYRKAFYQGFETFLKTGQGVAIEKTLELSAIKKGGTEFPIELSLSGYLSHGEWNAIGIIRDITDRKRADKALRESEERYRGLFNNVQVGLGHTRISDGKVLECNEKMAQIFGFRNKEKFINEFIFSENYVDPGVREDMLIKIEKSGAINNKAARFYRKDGSIIWIRFDTRIISEKGYMEDVVVDITEQKKAEEMIKQAKEDAELADKAKSQFLANMSHEIRTPMNAVIGFTDMLFDTNLDEEQIEYSTAVKSSGESLLSLINDILDFSKIEAGELDFDVIDFDPELLSYDVCESTRPRIGTKPIEVLCRIGDNLPSEIKGDPGRFRQVLSNLMGNAAKFTEAGEIELYLDVEEEKDDRIKFHAQIRDTGIGLAQEKLSNIFKPFHQADGSITRKYGGTGLGLSICKQIANFMDGDIWVESEVNKGSIFHFTAWLKKAEGKAPRRSVPVSLFGKKVLIVDDNQRNLEILTHTLKSVGMDVFALKKGEEVIRTFQDVQKTRLLFDLCIIDIQMPVMSGYDVVREIRNWEEQRQKGEDSKHRTPLIALSSLMQRDANKCKEAGFNAFLSKPVHREKLYQMLERMVAGRDDEAIKDKVAREKIITQYTIREEMKHSVRILLAEDNPVNQKLATMMLTKAGYQVEVAGNGNEAVEKYMASPADFDLIFMDIQMPEMDGLEATKEIRRFEGRNQLSLDNHPRQSGIFASLRQSSIDNQQSTISRVPIVAMTAHAMKGDMEMCLEAGMDDYITKPIKRGIVLNALEKWVFDRGQS